MEKGIYLNFTRRYIFKYWCFKRKTWIKIYVTVRVQTWKLRQSKNMNKFWANDLDSRSHLSHLDLDKHKILHENVLTLSVWQHLFPREIIFSFWQVKDVIETALHQLVSIATKVGYFKPLTSDQLTNNNEAARAIAKRFGSTHDKGELLSKHWNISSNFSIINRTINM